VRIATHHRLRHGVWREVGPNEFVAKYEFFATTLSDPEAFQKGGGWLPASRGVITERIKISPDGETFDSTIRYEALGTKGEPAEGGGEAKGRATRIVF
jgi:hypothetical protein